MTKFDELIEKKLSLYEGIGNPPPQVAPQVQNAPNATNPPPATPAPTTPTTPTTPTATTQPPQQQPVKPISVKSADEALQNLTSWLQDKTIGPQLQQKITQMMQG